MIIKYTFADGIVLEVEVDEAIGSLIIKYRQDEENLSRKERYLYRFPIEVRGRCVENEYVAIWKARR